MYKSPIDIIYGQMETQTEGTILKAIQRVGVDVDKDELVKALKYDRDQYRKGFEDGSRLRTDTIKAEVAMEIFAEIDKLYVVNGSDSVSILDYRFHKGINELKKKYTEEQE